MLYRTATGGYKAKPKFHGSILDKLVRECIVVLSDVNVIKYTYRDVGAEGLA
jgi:hypothetical protein